MCGLRFLPRELMCHTHYLETRLAYVCVKFGWWVLKKHVEENGTCCCGGRRQNDSLSDHESPPDCTQGVCERCGGT